MSKAHSAASRVRAALEDELSWRRDEIRNLRNLLPSDALARGVQSRRRALLVMLYAHLEGFTKFALERYAESINDAGLQIGDAKLQLSAACLTEKFKVYRSSDIGDPYDPSGNRARQVMKDAELVEAIIGMQFAPVKLPLDAVASAESNLTPAVLRRNLALLGLDDSEFHRFISTVDGLLRMRNNIAHGETLNLPSDPSFRRLEDRVFDLCESLMRAVYEAVRDEAYRRRGI